MNLTFYHWPLPGDVSFKALPNLGSLKENRGYPGHGSTDQSIDSLPKHTLKNQRYELDSLK